MSGSGDNDSQLALKLNPTDRTLRHGETLLVIAHSREHAESINDVVAASEGDGAAPDGAPDCAVTPWYSAALEWEMHRTSRGLSSVGRNKESALSPTPPDSREGSVREVLPRSEPSRPVHSGSDSEPPDRRSPDPDLDLMDHVVLSGCSDSFVDFARTLRAVWGGGGGETSGSPTLVVLHPTMDPEGKDADLVAELRAVAGGGADRVRLVRGSPSEAPALERASASRARLGMRGLRLLIGGGSSMASVSVGIQSFPVI